MLRAQSSALTAVAALALLLAACAGGSGGATKAGLLAEGSGGVYLALGDSIAAGSGASDPERTSYVALVAEALRGRFGPSLEVERLAVGGATTQSLIDEQLPAAVERLRAGEVRLVTLTISGNDLQQLAEHPVCPVDPSDPACPIEGVVGEIKGRLDRIMAGLRAAGPETPIAIQAYPNLFSGTGHMFEQQAEFAFGLLNEAILASAAGNSILVVDPREPFVGAGDELTHILDPAPDFHPNDAGYRVIARAFLEALGLEE